MLRGQVHAPKRPFAHAAAFYYHAEKRSLEAPTLRFVHSISDTSDFKSENPSVFLPRPKYLSTRPFQWRDANWGLITALLFNAFIWWALFAFAVPALNSALHLLFTRGTV